MGDRRWAADNSCCSLSDSRRLARAGIGTGTVGMGNNDIAVGDGGGANDGCGRTGASGSLDGADNSRASIASEVGVIAGAGKPVVGAAGMGAWAYSYCGYKLLIAALNSCQDSGSSNVSRVADHMSHDASSV